METRIAVIGIIIENPEAVERLNAILHSRPDGNSPSETESFHYKHRHRRAPECHQRPLRKTGHDPQCPYENRLFKSITIPGDLYD